MGQLGSELQSETENKGITFRLQNVADQLCDDDRKDFVEALQDKTISAGTLSRVLKRRGIVVSPSLISIYRRGGLSYEVR